MVAFLKTAFSNAFSSMENIVFPIKFDRSFNWPYVNTGSGIGFVPSGNMALPEPMLNQVYEAIRRHWPQWVIG